jgi:cytochrome P450
MVRLGPNTVSIDSEEGLRKIYSATSLIEKSPFYKAFTPGFTSSFSTLDGAYKEKKAIVAPAFAPKKLDAMEQIVVSHITSLCKSLKTETEIFLDESLSALTIDILSDVCFGQTLDLLHNPSEKEKISSGLEKAAAYISVVR